MSRRSGRKRETTRITNRNLRCESLEARQLLAVVTSAADSGAGSLRQAIIDEPAGGTITFDTAMMGGTVVTLSSGDLVIDKALTIDGDDGSGGRVTVDAAGTSRVFYIDNPSTVSPGPTDLVTLTNLQITGGDSADSTLRYGPYADGGGIQSFESLILDNVVVTGNKSLDTADGSGGDAGGLGHGREAGAVQPHGGLAGYLIIRDSEFYGNVARDDGGGLDFYNGTDITITGSTFRENTVGDPAGGDIAGARCRPRMANH